MGAIPFGISGDTPYPRREPVNRFTIDDVVTGWSLGPGAPRVQRLGGLPTFATDPHER